MTVPRVRRVIMSMSEKKVANYAINTRAVPGGLGATWAAVSFFNGPAAITGIQQGTTASTRIGNKIRISKISWSFAFLPMAAVDASGGNTCRFIIYHNKQTNGTLVATADIFQSNQVTSQRNINGLQKVTVLRDQTMAMVPTSATTSGPTYPLTGAIYPNKIIQYTGNTATIADMLVHDYGFAVISDAASCCEFYGEWQIQFTDV